MEKKRNDKKKAKKLIKKIMLVSKQNHLGLQLTKKLEARLKKYDNVDLYFDITTALKFRKRKSTSIRKFKGKFIITVGGDGTFLRTAENANVPVLPVKIEGHGFLCTITFKNLMKNLDKLMNDEYSLKELMRLKVSRLKKDKHGTLGNYVERIIHKEYPHSINEIVFSRKRPSKILGIEFKIDDVSFKFVGDGVLFSTPAGSTAYSASAGGSFVDPSMRTIEIVPLAPFFSKLRPMVVPHSKKIEVTVTRGECALILDGHGGDYVKPETRFLLEEGKPLKVISLYNENFYDKLKKELLE